VRAEYEAVKAVHTELTAAAKDARSRRRPVPVALVVNSGTTFVA